MKGMAPPEGLRFGGEWPWWTGPPVNEMPAAISAVWALFSTAEISVFLTEADVYSTGVQFSLVAFAPGPDERQAELERKALLDAVEKGEKVGDDDSGIQFARISPSWRSTEWGPDIQFVFADGVVAGDVEFDAAEQPAPTAALTTLGTGHGPPRWESRPFLYPLPPQGPMVVRCSWPSRGLEGESSEIDAGLLLDARPQVSRLP